MMPPDDQPAEKSFRLYAINGQGRIDRAAQVIVASSDDEAVAKAFVAIGTSAFELWDGARRVVVKGRGERETNWPGE